MRISSSRVKNCLLSTFYPQHQRCSVRAEGLRKAGSSAGRPGWRSRFKTTSGCIFSPGLGSPHINITLKKHPLSTPRAGPAPAISHPLCWQGPSRSGLAAGAEPRLHSSGLQTAAFQPMLLREAFNTIDTGFPHCQ